MRDHWHRERVGHIIGGTTVMITDKRVMDIDRLKEDTSLSE